MKWIKCKKGNYINAEKIRHIFNDEKGIWARLHTDSDHTKDYLITNDATEDEREFILQDIIQNLGVISYTATQCCIKHMKRIMKSKLGSTTPE
jgi:hypothetical protein